MMSQRGPETQDVISVSSSSQDSVPMHHAEKSSGEKVDPGLFRNVSDENLVSPQLFSQNPQSGNPACPTLTRRVHRLEPVLTAPNDMATSAGDSLATLGNDRENVLAANDRNFTMDGKNTCRQAGHTDAENCTGKAGGPVFKREITSYRCLTVRMEILSFCNL